jgi:hypothetical protein
MFLASIHYTQAHVSFAVVGFGREVRFDIAEKENCEGHFKPDGGRLKRYKLRCNMKLLNGPEII